MLAETQKTTCYERSGVLYQREMVSPAVRRDAWRIGEADGDCLGRQK